MHKVLWNGIINCKKRREKRNIDEQAAYCACCPLDSECGEIDDKEKKEVK